MKSTLIIKTILQCWKAGLVPMLHGEAGLGKSDLVRAAARIHCGVDELTPDHLRDNRLSTMDPVDIRGLCNIVNGMTEWSRPDLFGKAEKTVIFWDELNRGTPAVQNGVLQPILDKTLGNDKMPDGVVQVAAGNLDSTGHYVTKLDPALNSRIVHLDVDVDSNEWIQWGIENDLYEPILQYIRFRPANLIDYEKDRRSNPSPRSYHFASNFMKTDPDKEMILPVLSGILGEGVAGELVGFMRIYLDLPDPASILLDPENAPVPEDAATLCATTGALARLATPDNFAQLVKYYDRVKREFQVAGILDAKSCCPDIVTTPAFVKWAEKNVELFS